MISRWPSVIGSKEPVYTARRLESSGAGMIQEVKEVASPRQGSAGPEEDEFGLGLREWRDVDVFSSQAKPLAFIAA
jgi:hypothetical protein